MLNYPPKIIHFGLIINFIHKNTGVTYINLQKKYVGIEVDKFLDQLKIFTNFVVKHNNLIAFMSITIEIIH